MTSGPDGVRWIGVDGAESATAGRLIEGPAAAVIFDPTAACEGAVVGADVPFVVAGLGVCEDAVGDVPLSPSLAIFALSDRRLERAA